MDNLVKNSAGKLTVNSKQVAEHFGKTHRHVLRDIQELKERLGDFGESNFGPSYYISLQNKKLPCYEITRDGFSLLAMGFTGVPALGWKVKYIEAFNAMEKMLSGENSVMQQLNQAIKLMEDDKQIASSCGKGLGEWKKARAEHIKEIEDLNKRAQLLLNF